MKILMRGGKGEKWNLVESATYAKETELQHLLAESPGLISIGDVRENAGPLALTIREFPLPIGSLDILAFSADGDIAVIECKLAASPEVKRKVIGQVLEYAAYLWQMSYEDLDQRVKQRLGESLAEAMEQQVNSQDWDEEAFRNNVNVSLESGNFILIIVVDEINDELSRIVRFMNSTGNQGFDFAALEMRRFQNDHAEMLVPRFFGPSQSAKPKSLGGKRQWDEESFFAELSKEHTASVVNAARQILVWGKQNATISWGQGKQLGSFVPVLYHKEDKQKLFAVWTSRGVEIYFQWYAYKPSFSSEEKRIELLEKLNQIDGVNLSQDMISRLPSIPLDVLAEGNRIEQLLEVFDWLVAEFKKA